MDEIEYKLNTNNSVLIVNAIDKLISTIKSKYKPIERQRFVNENEELKFLREKCSSKDAKVSLTACQGLLSLVELGVLEIAHTMSTVVTLLPSTHNYSAIISTMAGLLILDLKARLVPGHQYKCQFTLKSPQHPFITVLDKNKDAEGDVLAQMHALCTHPDYTVSSNSLELLRPVFFWLTCHPQRECSIRPWQLLLSLPPTTAQSSLLLACLSCQQIYNPALIERSFAAYSAVTEAAVYQQHREHVMALLPMLARVSSQLIKLERDPRSCYNLIERCFALDAPELRTVAGITLMLLAENLADTSALYLHELFNLCINIISKYEYSSLSLNVFVALSLQWLNLPSYLTASALKVASKILDIYQDNYKDDTRLHTPNLKANKTFQSLLYTDSHLSIVFKLNQNWERMRDNPDKLKSWLDSLATVNNEVKLELLPFLLGMVLEKRKEAWYEEVVVKVIRIVIDLVSYKKEVSVQLLPLLMYKIANDRCPAVRLECLRALPLMAKTKENVPTIVSVLNKLKANKGVPTSFLIMLYTSLAETQVRCFPYLQEMLVDPGVGKQDDLKWELDIAKAIAVDRICEIRPTSHGLECVSVISSLLNRCVERGGSVATSVCVRALGRLWRGAALAPHSTWTALQPRLARDNRPAVQVSICQLLGEVPSLRVPTPEFSRLASEGARRLWQWVAAGTVPEVVEAACDALSHYKIDDYKLCDVPEIYRKTVKLPPSYCKTPADAARKPEEVLDYIPCEIWPEVFKYTNQAALEGVQRLASRNIERELRAYRSGQYQHDPRQEPTGLQHLQPTSVARGLVDCFRKQAISPSYEFPDVVLLSMLRALTVEYPKPLPPFDVCFLPEVFHRGTDWRRGCVTLAARQAQVSQSARRILENYLQGVAAGTAEETDVLLIFEILPILCRGMPPNALRPPLERCLADSFAEISHVKAKKGEEKEYMFIRQMECIRLCLECDKIHDANRTLLSQIVEHYFSEIGDDNVAWPTYVSTCRSLSSKYLERMSSPSAWWELSPGLLRKAASLRGALATMRDCEAPLNWLNEIIDAQAMEITEQEFSLRCMVPALQAADPDCEPTRDWMLQLMGRTQVAFNETEDKSAKQYLCDVFTVCVVVFSGVWCVECDSTALVSSRAARRALLPPAVAVLLARPAWHSCTLQLLEWVSHSRGAVGDSGAAAACQRALLAARHAAPFATHSIWTRLESHFGRDIIVDE
ncbi:focadhesin [Spodoptera frugiperda]|uniref:Focadhesin n=1 Tax=Spodoptera frugiperda TaxID=7108 RepID=A0A9R0EV15_SPOFR|nr:focadhesin [Spodoptera frugiperda]